MLLIARLLGVVITLVGIGVLVNPAIMKKMVVFWSKGKRIYTAGVMRLIFGVIFLLVASQSKSPFIVTILGLLFLAGGVMIFAMGEKKVKDILAKWKEKPLNTCRLLSIAAIVIGLIIVSSV